MKTRPKSPRPGAVPNRLWLYRKRRELTQRQVAEILGWASPTHLSHYERGRKFPSLVTALKLAAVCRVPVDFLFHDLYTSLKADLLAREERLRAEWEAHGGRKTPMQESRMSESLSRRNKMH